MKSEKKVIGIRTIIGVICSVVAISLIIWGGTAVLKAGNKADRERVALEKSTAFEISAVIQGIKIKVREGVIGTIKEKFVTLEGTDYEIWDTLLKESGAKTGDFVKVTGKLGSIKSIEIRK